MVWVGIYEIVLVGSAQNSPRWIIVGLMIVAFKLNEKTYCLTVISGIEIVIVGSVRDEDIDIWELKSLIISIV